jgi:hypothetical protein
MNEKIVHGILAVFQGNNFGAVAVEADPFVLLLTKDKWLPMLDENDSVVLCVFLGELKEGCIVENIAVL